MREKYVPWLEWKVHDMNDSDRDNFLESYAADDDDKLTAVMNYFTTHPRSIPNNPCSALMAGKKRSFDPLDEHFDPMKCPRNMVLFPKACRGEPMFGPSEHEVEESIGPRNETLMDDESPPKSSKLDGGLRGVGRRLLNNGVRAVKRFMRHIRSAAP